MDKLSDTIYDEIKRRIELTEYHLLSIYENANSGGKIEFHAKAALLVINPKKNYKDGMFCTERKQELEREYYDEYGRLKER